MLTDVHQGCWICEHHHYSIVLWSKDIGLITQAPVDREDKALLKEHLSLLNKGSPVDEKRPTIAGSFTQWQEKPMLKLVELMDILDPDFPPNLENEESHSPLKMKIKKMKNAVKEKVMGLVQRDRRERWKEIILKHSRYRRP